MHEVLLLGNQCSQPFMYIVNVRVNSYAYFSVVTVTMLFATLSEGARIWSRISVDCQEVLRPHLSSRYIAAVP